eukprot:4008890-Pleurochrysis_carterae.AAC.1
MTLDLERSRASWIDLERSQADDKDQEDHFNSSGAISPTHLDAVYGHFSTQRTVVCSRRYLLGRDFPGAHIGPEPTTDRFIAVMHGNEDKTTPGARALSCPRPSYALSFSFELPNNVRRYLRRVLVDLQLSCTPRVF